MEYLWWVRTGPVLQSQNQSCTFPPDSEVLLSATLEWTFAREAEECDPSRWTTTTTTVFRSRGCVPILEPCQPKHLGLQVVDEQLGPPLLPGVR